MRQIDWSGRIERFAWVVPVLLAVVALLVRELHIDKESLWLDEAFSVVYARKDLHFLLTEGLRSETNPPLYYVLLRGWVALFGDGEFAVRTLSAVFGALTAPILYLIGRKISGVRAGLVAATLFALSAYQIEYAQEARAFSLTALALSLALLGLVGVIAEAPDRRPRLSSGLLFVAGMTLAVYSHYTAIFYWIAVDLSLVAFFALHAYRYRDMARWKPVLLYLALCNTIALLLTLPALGLAFALKDSEKLAWIDPPSFKYLLAMLKVLLFTPWLGSGIWDPWSALATALALLAIAWSVVATRRQPLAGLMALTSVLCYALFAAVSEFRPVLIPRTTLWVPIPLYVLLGCAVAGITSGRLRLWAMASAVVFQVTAAALHLPRCTTEPWRTMIATMAREAGPEDLIIVLHGLSVPPLLYYWPSPFDAERCRTFDPAHKSTAEESGPVPVFQECAARLSPQEFRSALNEGRGLWLVGSNGDLATVRQWSQQLARVGTVNVLHGEGRTGSILVAHLSPPRARSSAPGG